jgi:hypothetical protein
VNLTVVSTVAVRLGRYTADQAQPDSRYERYQ